MRLSDISIEYEIDSFGETKGILYCPDRHRIHETVEADTVQTLVNASYRHIEREHPAEALV